MKLGYFRETKTPLAERMDELRRTLAAISDLAAKHRVTACLHTHSGAYVPSHGTMLYSLLNDLPPASVGAYVDTLHMHRRGRRRRLAGRGSNCSPPGSGLCAVKNYRWEAAGTDDFGMTRWRETVVPVAAGFRPGPGLRAGTEAARVRRGVQPAQRVPRPGQLGGPGHGRRPGADAKGLGVLRAGGRSDSSDDAGPRGHTRPACAANSSGCESRVRPDTRDACGHGVTPRPPSSSPALPSPPPAGRVPTAPG